GSDLQTAIDSLRRIGAIRDERAARMLLERGAVKPGRYRVHRGMSLRAIARMLHAGLQEPVRVTFSNVDHLHELAGRLGRALEPDSIAFLKAFLDPDLQRAAGLDEATMISLFLPNTYELWWTTAPERFIERMRQEHGAFWNADRRAKAQALSLTPAEVSTLASIVQAETVKMDDAPKIAGVYLNRLRIGMPLQADPTLKFALGADSVQRILHRDKAVDSPYNTYRHAGLPPGPINMPEPRFIDAVLNAAKHDYLYFCARDDLSGYSDFARTYEQHLVNARRYQKALNQRKIYR
ncbi:MAG: endolytic transglycosylase MltG, partial [Flavobacteriales bacterium]